MATDITSEADTRMRKAIDNLEREMQSIRTGNARPELIDHLQVEYYGTPTPLNQLAAISTPEARLLLVQPWDLQAVPAIEKAILKSDLGITPMSDGKLIRLPLPLLSQERRKDLVRQVHRKVEDGHIAIRNIRRDAIDQIRRVEKIKGMSQDESRRLQDHIQKLTDANIARMDSLGREKEANVLEV